MHCDVPIIIRNWYIYVAETQVRELLMMLNGYAELLYENEMLLLWMRPKLIVFLHLPPDHQYR
jgi:hypothetical protein